MLDSFSGSGTTAHAVLSLNQKDGGNRWFIGIEMMDYAETITAERIRRVINGYGTKPETQNGTGGGFSFYTVGEPLFQDDNLNPKAPLCAIRRYIGYTEGLKDIWHTDNGVSPHALGMENNTAYVFYYEENKITTLDLEFLQTLSLKSLANCPESWVIYADKVALSHEQLKQYKIVFKRIPRDISRF
nr:DNA methyltransferase [Neisseria lactamica]